VAEIPARVSVPELLEGTAMTKLLAPLILLAGCAIEPLEFDNHFGARFDIYNDGTNVRVVGCADAALFGCNEPLPGEIMTVTAGGKVTMTMHTPNPEPILDELGNVFMGGDFVVDTATPADGIIEARLAGSKARHTLPPAFAIDAPATFVRSQPLVIRYEPLAAASETITFVSTTCGSSGALDGLTETEPGRLELDLSRRGPGPCTHEVHIDQVVDDTPSRLVRIGVVNLTSEP
jgi:hypothetical protein